MGAVNDPVSAPMERRIALEGAVNFRDIGGYPALDGRRTRWRRVFRSDSLSALTPSDHRALAVLGVRTLVDFRLTDERAVSPNRLAPDDPIVTVEIGFLPEGVGDMLRAISRGGVDRGDIERAFLHQYRRFVTDHTAEFSRALALPLDDAHVPLLIHCTSGKDRTGFAIAALLLALGTPIETILIDYTLTNDYMRDITHLFGPQAPPELIALLMTAQPRYLEAAFDQMRASYGSIDAYLARGLGLGDKQRAQLIERLTERV